MTEIMILRNDVDGKTRLGKFLVDDNVLARLTKIRGNLYRDDSRLRTMADIPTMQQPQTPEPVYSPAAIEATEKAVALYKLMQKSKVTTSTHVIEPEPKPVLTFEEQLAHDWRFTPGIRKEFTSFGSYQAYMRAVESGRCRAYGV